MADEEKKSSSSMGKVVATIFGAVIAPIAVGVGIKWLSPTDNSNKPQQPPATQQVAQNPPPSTPTHPVKDPVKGPDPVKGGDHPGGGKGIHPGGGGKGRDLGKGKGPGPHSQGPDGGDDVINLVTPKLSDHFYTYTWNGEKKASIRNAPPQEFENFRYVANPPAIHMTGPGMVGMVTKRGDFENYELRVQFRWGEMTWPPRKDRRRWGAVMLHAVMPEGGLKEFPWPQSVSVHLSEGLTGNLHLLSPRGTRTDGIAAVKESNNGKRRDYVGGEGLKLPVRSSLGWDGMIYRLGFPDVNAEREDKLGWRPAGDPTHPTPGPTDWNEVLITSDEGRITVNVNGNVVNEIQNLNLKKGHIVFACNNAEFYLGKVELTTFRK